MCRDGDYFQKNYLQSYIWLRKALRIVTDNSDPEIVKLWNNDLIEIKQKLSQKELELVDRKFN